MESMIEGPLVHLSNNMPHITPITSRTKYGATRFIGILYVDGEIPGQDQFSA
jgi:hypothetical protein